MSETAAEAVADRLETSRDEVAITNGAARRIQLAVRRRAARLAAAPPPADLCSPPPGATTAPIWGEAIPPPTPADIPRVGAASFWSPVDALGAQDRWLQGVSPPPGSGGPGAARARRIRPGRAGPRRTGPGRAGKGERGGPVGRERKSDT